VVDSAVQLSDTPPGVNCEAVRPATHPPTTLSESSFWL